MSIVVARIDERLIHGQVAYSWSVAYRVTQIIVVDDEVANDPTQVMLLEMAVPAGKKHAILTVDDAVNYIQKQPETERIFVVVKKPDIYLELIEKGIKIPSINVGGMYYKKGKKEIGKTVYIDEDDKKVFLEIMEKGVPCEIRTSPNDKSRDLSAKI